MSFYTNTPTNRRAYLRELEAQQPIELPDKATENTTGYSFRSVTDHNPEREEEQDDHAD